MNLDEIKRLLSAYDSGHPAAVPMLHNNAQASLVWAVAEIERLTEEVAKKQGLIEFQCRDWADDDTRIKAVCAKHGVITENTGDYFKPAIECVEQLADKLTTAEADLAKWQTGGVTEELLRANNGCIKLGRGCSIVRTEDWDALQGDLEKQNARLVQAKKDAAGVEQLLVAAEAVVARWETPLWKDVEPTGLVINRLRDAIAAARKEPA